MKITAFILPLTWLIISTILLTIPGTKFPKDDWLGKIWFDKWVHVGMFGLLSFLWIRAFFLDRKKQLREVKNISFLVILCAIAYGTGMEFVQKYFVANRSFDLGDIIADTLGTLLGAWLTRLRYIKK